MKAARFVHTHKLLPSFCQNLCQEEGFLKDKNSHTLQIANSVSLNETAQSLGAGWAGGSLLCHCEESSWIARYSTASPNSPETWSLGQVWTSGRLWQRQTTPVLASRKINPLKTELTMNRKKISLRPFSISQSPHQDPVPVFGVFTQIQVRFSFPLCFPESYFRSLTHD